MPDLTSVPPSRCIELDADVHSAGRARRFVRETLAAWNRMDVEPDVSLAVSELVTNAVVHAHSPSTVTLVNDDGVVHVRVTDREPGELEVYQAEEEETHGRGLLLVQALSNSWGIEEAPPGKVVWLDIRGQ